MWVCKNCIGNETVCYVATLVDANCEKCETPTKAKDLNYIDDNEVDDVTYFENKLKEAIEQNDDVKIKRYKNKLQQLNEAMVIYKV